jgi:alpha-N-arabinofuranosidase
MKTATLTLDGDFAISEVDPRLFGGFAEHLGRHIYTGIYEPEHPTADENGFRQDVIELVRELNMPIMRYPGGNFVSGYRWEDGVGPKDERPAKLDLAWHALEPNTFGTNEFVDWCRKVGTEPMMAVNLGTRGPEAAQALVEYCNHPSGSYWSDLRRSLGWSDPHGIKVWCLGNEMDGKWQICSKTAHEYGRTAAEAAKMMKWVDPTIETVLCGSSGRVMPTFGSWEWESLHEAYDQTDYVSLHTYYGNVDGDTAAFFAKPDLMSDFIEETVALCDAVRASKKAKRKINLSFDEWNIWDMTPELTNVGPKWTTVRSQLEQHYTMEDAITFGGMLITLLSHADRVKIGCLAQVVNVIAPIMTEPGGGAWKQTTFHPFAAASRYGRGTVLQSLLKAPVYHNMVRDNATVVKCAAVVNDEGLTIFVINRDPDGMPVQLEGTMRHFPTARSVHHTILSHSDLKAKNSADAPDRVAPRAADQEPMFDRASFCVELPPYSWNVIHFSH